MTVALLRMMAPFFGPKIGEDQTKKRSSPQNKWVLGPNENRDQTKLKKKIFTTNRWSYGFTS